MDDAKKEKLKKVLEVIGDEDEKDILKLARRLDELAASIESGNQSLATSIVAVTQAVEKYKNIAPKVSESVGVAFAQAMESLIRKLDEVKSSADYKQVTTLSVPLYKTMIESISGVKKAIEDKPTATWRWPQYAAVSVRNRNFHNIDPSVDSLNIGEFDYVAMVISPSDTETYTFKTGGSSGTTVATVVIVYTSSARSDISSVTKTPIVSN